MSESQAKRSPQRTFLWLGLVAVCNHWSFAWLFVADGYISSLSKRGVLWSAELLALVFVLYLARRESLPRGRIINLTLLACICVGWYGTARSLGWVMTEHEQRLIGDLRSVRANEELHLALVPRFKGLGRALENLEIPGMDAEELFTEEVVVTDVLHKGPVERLRHVLQLEEYEWTLSKQQSVARSELALYRPLLDSLAWVEQAKAYLVSTKRSLEAPELLAESEAGYELLARGEDGRIQQINAHIHVEWVRELEGGGEATSSAWKISTLELIDVEVISAIGTAFEEVLSEAIREKDLLRELRENGAINEVVKQLTIDDWVPPYEYFEARSSDVNEAVSVVDYDGDGYDDLYFCADIGRNILLRNQGDGSFSDATAESGLEFDGLTSVALFFDYDNDGDQDCFLGRSHKPSHFLRNEGGVFSDITTEVFGDDGPQLVESASAADLDGDGLLDLYVSTYVGTLISYEMARPARPKGMLFDRQLSPEEARRFWALTLKAEEKTRDRIGPPNRLYQNRSGEFIELVSSPLRLYRNTYQATFSDYDGDGDQDVYVANDFAPNSFFRNDGDMAFVDVTEDSNSADIGFGMGATFGDYDHDGDFDLYVSNMFSKAGRRITASVASLDERLGQMARGNSLLELDNGRFDRVSSLDDSGLQVEKAGWSWGSMFVDADLDTWPDIYALSGMYTAPAPFESEVDL